MLNQLFSSRYDPAVGTLDQWFAKKHKDALKLGDMFATSKTFNQNMTTVLLTLLPPAFDTVSNAMRAAPPATWQEVVARLREYDSASRQENNRFAPRFKYTETNAET